MKITNENQQMENCYFLNIQEESRGLREGVKTQKNCVHPFLVGSPISTKKEREKNIIFSRSTRKEK